MEEFERAREKKREREREKGWKERSKEGRKERLWEREKGRVVRVEIAERGSLGPVTFTVKQREHP